MIIYKFLVRLNKNCTYQWILICVLPRLGVSACVGTVLWHDDRTCGEWMGRYTDSAAECSEEKINYWSSLFWEEMVKMNKLAYSNKTLHGDNSLKFPYVKADIHQFNILYIAFILLYNYNIYISFFVFVLLLK
jgi:hypothetical protein